MSQPPLPTPSARVPEELVYHAPESFRELVFDLLLIAPTATIACALIYFGWWLGRGERVYLREVVTRLLDRLSGK